MLLRTVAPTLPPARRAAFDRLAAAWTAVNRAIWHHAMAVLAERLAAAACDRQAVLNAGMAGRMKEFGAALGLRREGSVTPREQAMHALAERLDADVRRSTKRLIELHGLDGDAAQHVLTLMAEHYAAQHPVDENKAAVLGGLVTGALAGLKADIATGGLTLGGGLLAGGVIGALGAAGLARGYNLLRGVDTPTLAWTDEVLDNLVHAALLSYLAVAHHGRGRGQWQESEPPAFWDDALRALLAQRADELHALWNQARRIDGDIATTRQAVASRLEPLLADVSGALLMTLYPKALASDLGR